MSILQPPGWAAPKGYANGVATRGTLIFAGGRIGWNDRQQLESDEFVTQARQALCNVHARAEGRRHWARAHGAHDLVRD